MDIQAYKSYEQMSLAELEAELKNIKTGFEILNIRQSQIEMEMAHKENNEEKIRALVMQSSHLLEAQQEDNLEEQNWEDEQSNIEEERIQEIVAFGEQDLEIDFEDDIVLSQMETARQIK